MHLLVKFGVHQPLGGTEPAEPARLQLLFVQRTGERRHLFFVEIGVVAPLHELVPHLRVVARVQIDLVVQKCDALERRHGAEDISGAV